MGQEVRGLAEEVWEVRGQKIREKMGDLNGLNRKTGKVMLCPHVACVCLSACKKCCLKSGYAACLNHNTNTTCCTIF